MGEGGRFNDLGVFHMVPIGWRGTGSMISIACGRGITGSGGGMTGAGGSSCSATITRGRAGRSGLAGSSCGAETPSERNSR